MARRRRLLPDLRISAPSVVARILVWASGATDFRPSRSVGATVPVAAHSLQACRRAMAHRRRRFADLDRGISAPSVVARILARARGATDFRPSRSGGATVPVAAHRLRACRRAMAHRRRRFADLAIPLTPMLTHILTWVIDATDFRPSRSGGATVPVAAHSLQACRRAMAHRRRRFADLDRGISAPSVVARILARARGATDFRPSRSGGATVPVAAHRLRACRRAMAHRRRRFADLAIPLTPMLTHILTWVIDATDFRPSRSGGATVPVAAHSLQACRRAMAHRHRRFVDFRDSVNSHFNLHPMLALKNATLISAH
jgi:antitoxin component HigA of HigAB toxin-antitoxin module